MSSIVEPFSFAAMAGWVWLQTQRRADTATGIISPDTIGSSLFFSPPFHGGGLFHLPVPQVLCSCCWPTPWGTVVLGAGRFLLAAFPLASILAGLLPLAGRPGGWVPYGGAGEPHPPFGLSGHETKAPAKCGSPPAPATGAGRD
jgi:hypothetical protein